ncbi:MAG TPA: DUF885 family protein [Longimicrobiales bacterium]|nr:DUF885 family protein [Longimicrobiales bacterium]
MRALLPSPVTLSAVLLLLPYSAPAASAQTMPPAQVPSPWALDPPSLASLVDFDHHQSDLRVAVERYAEDRSALLRRWDVPYSPVRRARLESFHRGWLAALDATDFATLNREGQADLVLLRNRLVFELEMLRQEEREDAEMAPLVPFARTLGLLQEARRDRTDVDARAAAVTLDSVADQVEALTKTLSDRSASVPTVKAVAAERAARHLEELRRVLKGWYGFYDGYDPLFTWWAAKPYTRLDKALEAYAAAVRTRHVPAGGPVVGDPIGEAGLRAHLAHEMIPYTAEELIRIAEAEFEWMEEARLAASRELGFGDDWRAALEHVKGLAVAPGGAPAVVRELEQESVAFVGARDWISIPPLAQEIWRMEMMTPERQLVAPFFLGGEVMQISYPTDDMEQDAKLMSMRGNNPHFSRATVHHELIPGHHLQGFMTSRFNQHRDAFSTPFWTEGWALYWEMILWENDFPRGPEDRLGMLFWRMHRAARIIFSLSVHLERMTPQQAVDFLVDRVGHERANAEAEVRRSFEGSYPPLYQVAYMIGGMQVRSLRRELVESGRMTDRAFHDALLQGGRMPLEMVRARLTGEALSREFSTAWRFAGDPR